MIVIILPATTLSMARKKTEHMMQPMIKKEAENVGPVVAYFSELSFKEKNHYYRMTHNKQTNKQCLFFYLLFVSFGLTNWLSCLFLMISLSLVDVVDTAAKKWS